ncbi:MAG: hypothetical protein ACE5HU_05470 [Acidobacteriota bacterium]
MKTSASKSTTSKQKKAPAGRGKTPVEKAKHELKQYEAALKLFRKREFAGAAVQFEGVVAGAGVDRELCDRARTWAAVARRRASGKPVEPKDFEGCYYAGIVAANDGRLDEAGALLERAAELDPGSDKPLYALAAICGVRNDAVGAVSYLGKAIAVDPANRVRALNDPDFDLLREDSEFMSLLGKAAGTDA